MWKKHILSNEISLNFVSKTIVGYIKQVFYITIYKKIIFIYIRCFRIFNHVKKYLSIRELHAAAEFFHVHQLAVYSSFSWIILNSKFLKSFYECVKVNLNYEMSMLLIKRK